MSLLQATILLILIINVIYAQINPTYVNSTKATEKIEYFITSDYFNKTHYFRNNIIECTSSFCHIICDVPYGCYGLTINAWISDIITIECNANTSCHNLELNASANIVEIYCTDSESCNNAYIYVNYTDNIYIECNYQPLIQTDCITAVPQCSACVYLNLFVTDSINTTIYCNDYDCIYTSFDFANSSYSSLLFSGTESAVRSYIYGTELINGLSIECNALYACNTPFIYCPLNSLCNIDCLSSSSCFNILISLNNQFTDYLNLNCPTNESCQSVNIRCIYSPDQTPLIWDSSIPGITCSNHNCCPWRTGNITCVSASDCQIECKQQNCSNRHIDATEANSLTLHCENGCKGALIECPLSDSTSCNILCPNISSCENSYVTIGNDNIMNNFVLNCENTTSCAYIILDVNAMIIKNLNIKCDQLYGCRNLDLHTTTTIIDYLDINCISWRSCFGIRIDTKINKHANINCDFDMSCYSSNVVLTSVSEDVNMNVNCDHHCTVTNTCNQHGVPDASCGHTMFYLDGNSYDNNNMSFKCSSYDCNYASFFGVDLYYITADCDGQYSCNRAQIHAETTDHLNLDCNQSYSCRNAWIYCKNNNINVCDIECTAVTTTFTKSACFEMDIYYEQEIPPTAPITYSPMIVPSVMFIPSIATSSVYIYGNLHFICYYNDNKNYITTFLSLQQYANLMVDSILYVIHYMTAMSAQSFIICNVFNIELMVDIQCPSYSINSNYSEYVSIGILGFDIDNKDYIINEITSIDFRHKFSENMNERISNNMTNETIRRMLLEYNSFEAVEIQIIDTATTTRIPSVVPTSMIIGIPTLSNTFSSKGSGLSIMEIFGICLVIIIIILAVTIYYKRYKDKNKNKILKQNAEGAQKDDVYNENKIEMVKQENMIQGIGEGIFDDNIDENIENDNKHNAIDQIENKNDEQHNMEGDIVNIINVTHDNEGNNNYDNIDNDIIKSINKTVIGDNIAIISDNNNDDQDIVKTINQTQFGENIENMDEYNKENNNMNNDMDEYDDIQAINETAIGY